jgi:hypothetical protein
LFASPWNITSWWTEEIARAMQQLYEDLVAGKRPMLAIGSPPQHGKSWAATDLIAWVAGKNPDLKAIYASYSDELGTRTNVDLQRMMQTPQYKQIFPDTRVGVVGWQCNTSLIEYAGRFGSFRNTTTMGSINGMELHLGVIDDPVKGRAEASSKTTRERLWNWFTDDWGSRNRRREICRFLLGHVGGYTEALLGPGRPLPRAVVSGEDGHPLLAVLISWVVSRIDAP